MSYDPSALRMITRRQDDSWWIRQLLIFDRKLTLRSRRRRSA